MIFALITPPASNYCSSEDFLSLMWSLCLATFSRRAFVCLFVCFKHSSSLPLYSCKILGICNIFWEGAQGLWCILHEDLSPRLFASCSYQLCFMTPVTSVVQNTIINLYLVTIMLCFLKKSELSAIPRGEGWLHVYDEELSLFLGPKCFAQPCVVEMRIQVWNWEPEGCSDSRQTSPPEKKLPGDGEFLGRFCCNWKVTEHIESRFGDLQGHLQGHSGKGELFMNFFYLVVGVCIPVGIITLKFLSSEELKVFVNIQ